MFQRHCKLSHRSSYNLNVQYDKNSKERECSARYYLFGCPFTVVTFATLGLKMIEKYVFTNVGQLKLTQAPIRD